MIVKCDGCATSFQLDDSRVPPSGIRVRCSRCKRAFFLAHPSASQPEVADDIAADAAASRSGAPPSATQDLSSFDSPTSDVPGEEVAAAGADGEASGESEENWEFNDDSGASGSSEDGADAFGSLDDFSSLIEDDPVHEQAALAGADDGELAGPDDVDLSGDDEDAIADLAGEAPHDPEPVLEAEPEVDRVAAEPSSHESSGDVDLGDPEEWDFFSDESLESVSDIGAPAAPVRSTVAPAVQTTAAALAREPELSSPHEGLEQGRIGAWLGRMGRGAGWLATSLLVAFGVSNSLPQAGGDSLSGARVVLAGMQVGEVDGRWIDTARAGKLFAVRGRLANPTASPKALDAPLEIALLDERGRPLEGASVHAGLAPAPRVVRELAPDQVRAAQAQGAADLAWLWLAPGESVEFLGLFPELPDGARRFAFALGSGDTLRPVVEAGELTALPAGSDGAGAERDDAAEPVLLPRLELEPGVSSP